MRAICIIILFQFAAISVAQKESTESDSLMSPVHLREVPKHNLRVAFGIAEPFSDYQNVSNTGLSFAVGYDLHFTKNFAITTQLQHTYNEFGIQRQAGTVYSQQGDDNWNATSISVGPQFSYQSARFQLDLYTRAGLLFVQQPDNVVTTEVLSPFTVVDTRNLTTDDTALLLSAGVRFNYYFRRSVQLYFEPQYSTGLGDNIDYLTNNNGELNTGRFNNLILSVGVKLALGKEYSNGEMRIDDYPDFEE